MMTAATGHIEITHDLKTSLIEWVTSCHGCGNPERRVLWFGVIDRLEARREARKWSGILNLPVLDRERLH